MLRRSFAHGSALLLGLWSIGVLAGCGQALDVGGRGDAGPERSDDGAVDGGWFDSGSSDGGSPDAGSVDAGPTGLDACAPVTPILAVAVRSVEARTPTRVARFSLRAGGPTRCEDLEVGGELPPIRVLGWMDETRLVFSSDRELGVIDTLGDRIESRAAYLDPASPTALDAFGIRDASGVGAVVSVHYIGSEAIDRFYVLSAEPFGVREVDATDLDTRRLRSCDTSPRSGAMLCVEPPIVTPLYGTEAAAKEIDLAGGAAPDVWLAHPSGTELRHVSAGADRILWIARTAERDELRWADAAPGASVRGPTSCTSELCRAPRALVDVAVDPTDPDAYFAICRGLSDGTHVPHHVIRGRLSADGAACEVLLDGRGLPQGVVPIALDASAP